MKAFWKCFIIGIVIIAIGAGILITTLAVNGWSVSPNYTLTTVTAEQDNTAVEIDAGLGAIKTEFYDGEKIEITYPVSKVYKTEITERDGKLTYAVKNKWYASFFNFSATPETVIKLPKNKVFEMKIDLGAGTVNLTGGVYANLDIDVSAGRLDAAGVTCERLDCDVSAGTVKLDGVNCSVLNCDVSAGKLEINSLICPDIDADVSAGRLEISVDGTKSEYTIISSVSAGSCNVSDQTGTTGKKLKVDCSAGSIDVSFGN